MAPIIFVCHFLEEAPGFVSWFNAHVSPAITTALFWNVNVTALVITVAVLALDWQLASKATGAIAVAWLSFLMFANALIHIVGALIDRAYVPGLVTAILLYLPYYLWFVIRLVSQRRLRLGVVLATALLGSVPMAVHGYRILFLGSRLF